ncbi:hypothetical protein [Streptomyces sp. NPDC095817]|uniref:hypothetical protein n=1 Tax=unclassified Streptomyces TaxID=2593676 RepID=UPI0033292F91
MPHDEHRTIDPAELPPVVIRNLAAHRDRDTDTALTTLTDDASVTDDGTTYEGTPAIAEWLGKAAGEYTYTPNSRRPTAPTRPTSPRPTTSKATFPAARWTCGSGSLSGTGSSSGW